MTLLIVMWFTMQPVCADARGCMERTTAVAMHDFTTLARCEAARAHLANRPGLTAKCVKQ